MFVSYLSVLLDLSCPLASDDDHPAWASLRRLRRPPRLARLPRSAPAAGPAEALGHSERGWPVPSGAADAQLRPFPLGGVRGGEECAAALVSSRRRAGTCPT
ncbi:unnamed protein product [Prorocentrum cordatum]|uniref:Uncharacterized protein n=1 Tax=Prorocentrum cordatum TaxID=2364126 RepID=A0ABN9RRM8_9DINO|nr:unnamed protein product [Polarella glacialis]